MKRYFAPLANILAVPTGWGSLTVGPDGTTLHTSGYGGGGVYRYRRSDDQGTTWQTPVEVDTGASNHVLEHPLVVTASGVLVVVYEAGLQFRMRRSIDNGVNWSAPTVIHTFNTGQFIRSALVANGETIHMVYSVINGNTLVPYWRGTMYYRKSTDGGLNWTTAVEPYPNGGTYESASRPDMCVNGNIVHFTWAGLRTGETILTNEEILTGRSTDAGSTWETVIVHKNNSATYAHRPDIVTDPNDVVLLLWQESLDGGGSGDLDLRFRRSDDNGATWGSIVRMTNSTVRAEHGVIAIRGNRAAMLWAEYGTGISKPNGRYSGNGGITWTDVEIAAPVLTSGAPSIDLSNDFIQLVGTDDAPTPALYAFRSWFDVTEPVETNLMENFEGAATGPPPSGNWTNGVLTNIAGEGLVIDGSGRATRKSTGGYRQGSRWNAGTFGTDFDIVIEIDTIPDVNGAGIHFGIGYTFGASNLDGYGCNIERSSVTEFLFEIFRYINSSTVSIALGIETPTIGPGSKLGFQKRGKLLRVLHKPSGGVWTIMAEWTDSTFIDLVGYPFLELTNNQSVRVPNMWASTIGVLDVLRPDADIVTTGWTTAPLYSKVNDDSDATVIQATAS